MGVLGVVPPRTVLSGEPWNHGWVALDNEEGWVHGDDLRMLLRPAPPRRFARSVDVPTDALTRHATSCVNASGSLAEVAASDSNVQLPQETTQHWHASAC